MKKLCWLAIAISAAVGLVCACGVRRVGIPDSVNGDRVVHDRQIAIPALYSPGGDDPQSDQSRNQPFQIAETGPSGTVPHENLEGGVWVLFNRPVVPLAKLAKPISTSTVLSISPRVDGIYRWYGSRLLAFEP